MPFWEPQLGPQLKAVTCPADFPFFGGSRGGGKTDGLIGRQLLGADRYKGFWNGLVLRRKYKDFAELRRRTDELIAKGLPAERTGGEIQTNHITFKNGARVTLAAINQLEQVNDFVGHQYTEIAIDECTTFPFFLQMVEKLKGSLRSPHGVPCHMFGTGNPGGPGHQAVKDYFKLGSDGVQPETVLYTGLPNGMRESRIFIPSFLKDNKILCDNDPMYVGRLMSITDPALRAAWLDGNWDVYIGQAFAFSQQHHVIDYLPPPHGAPVYTTLDWGFGKPFSWGWWWIDADGRAIRFAEWYGSNGNPDEGLRLPDSDIAQEIREREIKLGINQRQIAGRLAGPDCFSKKPDYQGGGQGKSTAEVFAENGIFLTVGDPSRHLKIRQFRERLKVELDGQGNMKDRPLVQVCRNCKDFIRTIPGLCMDETNPEDIDCFVAGTIISTPTCGIPIEQLKVGDIVDTPLGPREIEKSYKSGECETCVIELSNGKILEGTPHHKIYIKGYGILPLCVLSSGQQITTQEDLLWLNQLYSTGSSSPSVTTEGISNAIRHTLSSLEPLFCTELFGKNEWVRYQRDIKSTIGTTTHLTTALGIWNWFIRALMLDTTTKKDASLAEILSKHWRGGERQRLGKVSFETILKEAVRLLPKDNLRAQIVASILQHETTQRNIVQRDAKNPWPVTKDSARFAGTCSMPSATKQNELEPVVISAVGRSGRKPVYNLTVRQAHLFYANGVLSSNTDQEDHIYDEACHIFMARPIGMEKKRPRRSHHDRRIDELYAGSRDRFQEAAEREQEAAFRDLGLDEDDAQKDGYEDTGEYATIRE